MQAAPRASVSLGAEPRAAAGSPSVTFRERPHAAVVARPQPRENDSERAEPGSMTFETPQALWLLLALPLLAGLYVLLQRRRVKGAVRYARLDVLRAGLRAGARTR